MAFSNFKPTLWADGVEHNFPKMNVFAALTNQNVLGNISYGNKVIINSIGEVSTSAYTGSSVSFETLNDFDLEIPIDQKKYFAVTVDDVDEIQSKPDVMANAQIEIGKAVADDPDVYIAGLYTESGLTSGTTGSPTSLTSANIISTLGSIRDQLRDNKVRDDLVAVVPPWFLTKIDYSRIIRDTNNSAILTAGYVGRYMGFDLYESDNIQHSGSTWYSPMFFAKNKTIGFGMQMEKIEAGRHENTFGDYIKGLMVYGAKTYRPDAQLTLYCANGAESAI